MTELESLAKDCIENHTHKLVDNPTKQDIYLREESIYISGYKDCEKKVKDLIHRLITIYCDQTEYDEFGNTLEEARHFLEEQK